MVVLCATAAIVVAPCQAGKVRLLRHGGSASIGPRIRIRNRQAGRTKRPLLDSVCEDEMPCRLEGNWRRHIQVGGPGRERPALVMPHPFQRPLPHPRRSLALDHSERVQADDQLGVAIEGVEVHSERLVD